MGMLVAPISVANAAPEDQSEALGQVISTDLLDIDLADLNTAHTGFPSEVGPESTPLNLELFETLTLDLGDGISLPLISQPNAPGLLDLGEVGALNSFAESPNGTTSTASAGAVGTDGAINLDPDNPGAYGPAQVDLTNLFAQLGLDAITDAVLDEASLELGAAASTATKEAGDVSSEYLLAGADLNVSSPLVGDLTTGVDGALGDVGDVVNGALATDGVLGETVGALEALNLDLVIAQLGISDAELGINGLDTALTELSNTLLVEPLEDENGMVSVNLSTGVIHVDLEQVYADSHGVEDLNGLGANTRLLDEETISGITTAVAEALGTLTTKVTDGVEDVLNNTEVVIDLGAQLRVAILSSDVDITVNTTLGYLAGTSDVEPVIEVDGNLLGLPLGSLLGTLSDILVPAVLDILRPAVGGLLDTAGDGLSSTLTGVLDPVLDGLGPVFDALNEVAEVTINEQPEPGQLGDESFTVNALSLEVLPAASVANVDLGSSTVRALDEALAPGITVSPASVPAGSETTVTGTDFGPEEDVTVTLVDPDTGDTVGEPVVVTTDALGNFTTTLPVDEGATAKDYTVNAASETGEATAPLTVTVVEDGNENASSSASASADADSDANASAQAAAQAAANADADTTASAAADADASAAAQSAAEADASTDASADVSTDANAASSAAADAAANTDADSDSNADTTAAADANAAAAASVAANADSSSDASAAAAADADANADATADAEADAAVDADATADADGNENASASAATSADADSDANASAQAAAQAAANADADTTASAAADADASAAAQSAAEADASTDASADVSTDANAASSAAADAAANTDADSDSNADTTAAADANAAAAASVAANADSSSDASAAAAADADANADATADAEANAGATADADSDASPEADADANGDDSASASANANASASASASSNAGAGANADGGGDGDDDLPRTGAESVAPILAIAAMALLVGGGILMVVRRRKV
ncbi:choice-of-anchor G family protein [Brevibacterium yomogidense]|uniref:choice-of-anchor G family protein n=2 Tax=Brevibacterium yomogidense TaxID=946573 RepID=UPI0018DF021D|nr:choice-of-anchor G family protein [Brevibacterium yomogidense]